MINPSEFDAAIEEKEICEKAEAAERSVYIFPIIPFGNATDWNFIP